MQSITFFLLFLSLVGCGGGSSEEETSGNGTLGTSNDGTSNDGFPDAGTENTVKNLMKLNKEYQVNSNNIIIAQERNTKIKLTITNSKTTAVMINGNAEIK